MLIRTDAAGATHDFLDWLQARKLSYSLGFTLPDDAVERIAVIRDTAWTPAYDDERTPWDGAWVAETTGIFELSGWPPGMRVIVRKERPVRREALLIRAAVRGLRRRSCRSRTVELRAA